MHILYVDESGDDGFSRNGNYDSPTPSRFFVRTGIIIHDKKWQRINNELLNLRDIWAIPTTVELHANPIRRGTDKKNVNGKKKNIKNWYGQKYPNFPDRIRLLNDFCSFANNEEITIICVAIDKTKININASDYKKLPKEKSWELLVERYNLFLKRQKDKIGIIISDAIQNKIEQQHRDFVQAIFDNSSHVKPNHFIETILFEPSDSSNFLQLADLVSYSFFRYFSFEDDSMFNFFSERILKNDNDEQKGAGLKIWPE